MLPVDVKIFLLIFARSIFDGYLILCLQKFGLTRSISKTFKLFPQNQKYLYTLYMWLFCIPEMLVGETYLLFFAGVGIALTGTAANTGKTHYTDIIHSGGVFVGVICGLLSMIIDYGYFYIPLLTGGIIILFWRTGFKNNTYWIEVLAERAVWWMLFYHYLVLFVN